MIFADDWKFLALPPESFAFESAQLGVDLVLSLRLVLGNFLSMAPFFLAWWRRLEPRALPFLV